MVSLLDRYRLRLAEAQRTIGPGGYPTLSREEWENWLMGPEEFPRLRYPKEMKTDNALEDHPDGFLIDRDHPDLEDLKGKADIFNMPGEGTGGPLFVRPRPKEPLTS